MGIAALILAILALILVLAALETWIIGLMLLIVAIILGILATIRKQTTLGVIALVLSGVVIVAAPFSCIAHGIYRFGREITKEDTTPSKKEPKEKREATTQEEQSRQLQKPESGQPPEPQPIALSGKGQQATQKFALENDLSIFEMVHSGQSNFIVNLLDEQGNETSSLVNEIGSFQGSKAVNIPSSGTYLLNVQADGNWQITIKQPRPAEAPATNQFSGKSQQATNLFYLSEGMKVFKMKHSGESNFIVQLLDKNGSEVSSSLVNEIGNFDGSKAVKIETSDIYLLNVAADGDWSISIE